MSLEGLIPENGLPYDASMTLDEALENGLVDLDL